MPPVGPWWAMREEEKGTITYTAFWFSVVLFYCLKEGEERGFPKFHTTQNCAKEMLRAISIHP